MWAAFFWKSGDFGRAVCEAVFRRCFDMTLGYGDVVLSKPWRGLGPMRAMNGLLVIGCSTAAFSLVLQMVLQHGL